MTLEVFFDYACPYCLRAHEPLMELLSLNPAIEAVWRPCESHPRPDRYGPHSDLLIRGMFFAKERGLDLPVYHNAAYRAALQDRVDIEDAQMLAEYLSDILDAHALLEALLDGAYLDDLREANRYAFRQSGVWVVPALRLAGRKLDALENVGLTKGQMRSFLEQSGR